MAILTRTTPGFGAGNQDLPDTSLTIIVVFLSISTYNSIELACIIWGTFKRYSGLYFWSFLIATLGIPLSTIGFFIKYFVTPTTAWAYFSCTLSTIGWVCMVTGQSMVLWSRLHLVMRHQSYLRVILWIIIIDAILCHGSVIPMVYGSFGSNPGIWSRPYYIAERIEVIIFFLQEIMLSSLYIGETFSLMRLEKSLGNSRATRRFLKNLILVNVVVIILDITILTLEFANFYDFQISYKVFAYSVKLKLEFTVLNRLVYLATGGRSLNSSMQSRETKTTIAVESVAVEPSGTDRASVWYHAHIVGGKETHNNARLSSPAQNNDGVMMTTAVTVQRETRLHVDEDAESTGRKTSGDTTVAVVSTCHTEQGRESAPEIQLLPNNT